ncbi:4'-phosphopantetheinyl transferase [Micromonospora profundi]|uniref:4'-phosphopantetheinyl transferase family protein n=1 Tax=Micromonospora profundi TaxID=1420889 RepID=UPI0014387C85|nr:4'-phosphopantetheinyl transferase superfamily protein [Micromonospora profundi]NJC11470.1 4'-phosphopantetheinyl transferase [Micromonospora profundi]
MKPAVVDCRVWWIDPAHAPRWCEELLSEPERARAESIHRRAARRRFTTATALLKVAVAVTSGGSPGGVEIRRACPDCRRLHGRPVLAGGAPYVSLSHSGDRVAVALCADAPVGVDVEQVDAGIDVDAMVPFVLGASEQPAFRAVRSRQARVEAFFRCWTRKEAVLKATGDGLRIPMREVTVGTPYGPARLIGFPGRPELPGTTRIVDLRAEPGYLGAVAVLTARPVRVIELDGRDAFAATAERHGGS